MTESCICAVIVTYRPGREVLRSLANLRNQTPNLVVVDNCSAKETQEWLHIASSEIGFKLIQHQKNLGIAYALNIGIRWAESHGYKYVILFDQDSVATDGFVRSMAEWYFASPHSGKIAILAPIYMDSRLNISIPSVGGHDGHLQVTMSSGSFMPIGIFRKVGWFEEGLFIDYVDYEYCLRVRTAGYVIEECKDAVLLHAPGDPQRRRLLGPLVLRTANYSPLRRYYIARNVIWVMRRYWSKYPNLCLVLLFNVIKDHVKLILVENQKRDKVRSSFMGLIDGISGYMDRNVTGLF